MVEIAIPCTYLEFQDKYEDNDATKLIGQQNVHKKLIIQKTQCFGDHFSPNTWEIMDLYFLLNIIPVFYFLPSCFETVKDTSNKILEF